MLSPSRRKGLAMKIQRVEISDSRRYGMNAPIKDARLREAIEYAFGANLDDVLLQMKVAANTLDQLEALFASINGALEKTGHRLLVRGQARQPWRRPGGRPSQYDRLRA